MKLPVLSIRKLIRAEPALLWDTLDENFIIRFDDGDLTTNRGQTLYCIYMWQELARYEDIPILKVHHLTHTLGEHGRLSIKASNRLLSTIINHIYDWHVYGLDPRDPNNENMVPDPKTARVDPLEFREYLARRIWEINNLMYNDLVVRTAAWVMRVDTDDLIEVVSFPGYKELLDNPIYTQSGVDRVYDAVDELLLRNPAMAHNPLSKLLRSGLINDGQLKQCVGARGFMSDMDSYTFPVPVMRNFVNGVRSAYDSLTESRSMAKSLAYSEKPLEQSEYFSRRQQLVSQTLRRLHEGDCGATEGMLWTVDADDLKHLAGMNYYGADGKLRYVREHDKHLIGTTINMRILFKCRHPDHQGVCTTCFGQLSFAVFKDSNLGQDTSVSMCSDVGQRVLSTKHLDGSSKVDSMTLDALGIKFLRVGRDGASYTLAPDLARAERVELLLDPTSVPGFTDIFNCKSTTELYPARVSRMTSIDIRVVLNGIEEVHRLDVGLERRKASLTFDMLNYIRANPWSVDTKTGQYVVDITELDYRTRLLTVPLRQFNMADQAKAVASLLESTNDKIKERDENLPITEFIADLYETVNSKLSVNLAVLIAITYSIMIVSAERGDYSLPKPWTDQGLGVRNQIFRSRSAGNEMAFQGQQQAIIDPRRYNNTNVLDHQMDVFIAPQEVLEGVSTDVLRARRVEKLKGAQAQLARLRATNEEPGV